MTLPADLLSTGRRALRALVVGAVLLLFGHAFAGWCDAAGRSEERDRAEYRRSGVPVQARITAVTEISRTGEPVQIRVEYVLAGAVHRGEMSVTEVDTSPYQVGRTVPAIVLPRLPDLPRPPDQVDDAGEVIFRWCVMVGHLVFALGLVVLAAGVLGAWRVFHPAARR